VSGYYMIVMSHQTLIRPFAIYGGNPGNQFKLSLAKLVGDCLNVLKKLLKKRLETILNNC
jgi:hypothetical protein